MIPHHPAATEPGARVIDLAAVRRARTQPQPPAQPVPADCGDGWYHEAAVRAEADAHHAA